MAQRYTFNITVEEEDDGQWSAWLNAIPWCATFGATKGEAVEELWDAASVVVQYLLANGRDIPVDEPLQVTV